MKQREVTASDNTKWTCVQAYAGIEGKVADKIAELSGNEDGKVPVVCTPSGGAQSVRLELAADWESEVSDEDLVTAIEGQR